MKIGFTYPLPENKIKNFIKKFKSILVVEELDPILENELMRLAKEANPKLKIFGKNLLPSVGELKIEDVIRASNNGDRFVRNIFLEEAGYIGGKLTDIANILNPEIIILRGSIIDGNSFLFENIERIIKTRSLSALADSIKVIYTDDTSDIRIPGVSSYILMNYFRR